uniref:Liprin-beta-1/2 coiled-coil domain-containing protein n=1 Tax=Ditylenchus dipsaci TaxID=166011 RepID=A0A915CR51_9BILA
MNKQEEDGFREANLMLANALKQLDEALNGVTPNSTSAVPRRKSWYRSRSSPASHILTQSGLIYPSPTTKLNKISEEKHKQMSEHAVAPLAVTPFNILYLDDNSNQCHPSPPRQFQSFSSPPPHDKANNGTANAKTSATTTSSITHADMHRNGWQKIENEQQDVLNGNRENATIQLEESNNEDTFANGHSVHSTTESLTQKSHESASPVQAFPPLATSSQIDADMDSSEKPIWVWSANQNTAENNANVEDGMESGAESSVFGAESPPSVHQSSSSSAKPADVHLNRLIKAIDEEKLAVPDSGAKMKILKWLSFSSDAPPIGAEGQSGKWIEVRLNKHFQFLLLRPILPYIAQYSDSGFSSFSSCSYLPPPPPYRTKGNTNSNDVPTPESTTNHQQETTSISNLLSSMVTEMEKEDAFHPTNPTPTLNLQKDNAQMHRIHRSLSDSKSYSGNLLQPEDEFTSRQKAQKAFLSLRRGGSRGKKRHEVRSASGSIALGEPSQNASTAAPSSAISSTIQWQLGSELHHTRLGGSCSEAYSGTSRPALTGTVNNRYSAASSSHTTTTNNSMMSLSPSPSMVSTVSCPEYPELQEKLHKLAMARDTLSMQVTVLNDQVGLQKEKIRDLEALLESKRNPYPYEMLSEQSIMAHENNKSHLMNEICDLKNKFSFLEKEKSDAERKLTLSHNEIERLSQSMINMQMAAATPHSPSNFSMPVNAAPPPTRMLNSPSVNGSNMEMEKLRETVQKLIADNAQKNMEISSLRNALDEQVRSVRDFDSFTSAGYESNSQRSSVGAAPTPLLNVTQQPTMDINAQLRKLLIEDMKENIAHSSSYPTSLCNSMSSHQLPPHQPPSELGKNPHW